MWRVCRRLLRSGWAGLGCTSQGREIGNVFSYHGFYIIYIIRSEFSANRNAIRAARRPPWPAHFQIPVLRSSRSHPHRQRRPTSFRQTLSLIAMMCDHSFQRFVHVIVRARLKVDGGWLEGDCETVANKIDGCGPAKVETGLSIRRFPSLRRNKCKTMRRYSTKHYPKNS